MDRHLNIFEFFNNHSFEYYEDNLSRAFALCLKYDTVLLDNILKKILDPGLYDSLFNTDNPDYKVNIDLQKRISDFGNYSRIIAVACSVNEIEISRIAEIPARAIEIPETDLCIEINDTCIIFEFKKTIEDCSAQLKCQAEKIRNNGSSDTTSDTTVTYIDLNWSKIVRSLLNVLSLQKQINTENPFTLDLAKFLERKQPDWFPKRLLSNISFPKDENDPNNYYLNSRLDQLKTRVFGPDQTKEFGGTYDRLVISVDWGCASEIHVDFNIEEGDIKINIYLGDTKAQGWNLFKPDRPMPIWPKGVQGYVLRYKPYIAFKHWTSTMFWYCPDESTYQMTHTRASFEKLAGRWKKPNWNIFENLMSSFNSEWNKDGNYAQYLSNSNRSYFDLSLGILLSVCIPYKKAQELDNNELNPRIAEELRSIIQGLKEIVNEK